MNREDDGRMEIVCPHCRRIVLVPQGSIGRRCRCWGCRAKFIIPDPDRANLQTVPGRLMPPLGLRITFVGSKHHAAAKT